MPFLTSSSLRFSYGIRPAINGVALTLTPGEIVALLGPNGSGKSTLLKLLLGHLHGEGTILWDDKPLRQWPPRSFARRVAYLPQSPVFDDDQTVFDALRLGRAPYWGAFGLETDRDIRVLNDVAHRLELTEILERRMDEISGGQRQRVFLGRCLAQEPAAMLLDEPNTFLDLRHQVELARTLRRLAAERSMAILMASHDLNLAATFADRLLLLHEGTLVADAAPTHVLSPDLLSRVYGVPMRRLDPGAGGPPIVFPVT
jgi:iron complex transport system ATP-binding protein